MSKRQNLLLIELEFHVTPIATHPELHKVQRIRSQYVNFHVMVLRDSALNCAVLVLDIEINHLILTKKKTWIAMLN
jgi:hypothetical protein